MRTSWLVVFFVALALQILWSSRVSGFYGDSAAIESVSRRGAHVGIVVPNMYEFTPLLEQGRFVADATIPFIDIGGRRFHIGTIHGKRSIVVISGLSMLNAGITTQQLLDHFRIDVVLHYGIAGSSNPSLHIADVSIASSWIHTGLWYWQRYGQGPNDELSLEQNGDYTRLLGNLHFGSYNDPSNENSDNKLGHIYFQPEEVFPITGTPEVRQHAFKVPVSRTLYETAQRELMNLELKACLNSSSCLSSEPKVLFGLTGSSANVFLDNAAYRTLLYDKFGISSVDMESAAVALTCYAQGKPFIIFRSISDLAGGSDHSNEAIQFIDVAAENAVIAVVEFIRSSHATF
ncbi:hypothetical protein SELMODRAFT_431848 [Selaginella moellendorffii]|uniref:Nucleoside phosphorylase domain-containing protein n=1 Tax=Selaginella moellendorffii TaxID=88036 RepID=D8TDZ8_SELML|nr:bark storage protein A [Selaginella moellendorffii]EFJ05106.1 hypothetical protein SELMODRAFT_431848 [Selaginella moellendorffii]|eukprot:XP_002993814.1 bark storage protein A [Selaginella moellendorffii]